MRSPFLNKRWVFSFFRAVYHFKIISGPAVYVFYISYALEDSFVLHKIHCTLNVEVDHLI